MRLACVPFPAPGGPSSTTGPTSREVSCAIDLAKASRPQSPRLPGRGAATPPTIHKICDTPQLPGTTAANASATRRKPVVVTHDQLRLDLRDCVHGHTNHNQQRRAPKIEAHTQPVQRPVRENFEESPDRAVKVVEVET